MALFAQNKALALHPTNNKTSTNLGLQRLFINEASLMHKTHDISPKE